jgi:NADH-quinone oxidoreductase subunit B
MAVDAVDRLWVEVGGRRVALHVLELGLACCGIEVREARRLAEAAGAVAEPTAAGDRADGPDNRAGGTAPSRGEPLHVLVVAGTVTTRLAPVVVEALAGVPEPRAVLAFGACAATGGPYWDSYSVLPGAHEVVPVDAWVAGCPPRPEDLLAGLVEVLRGRP